MTGGTPPYTCAITSNNSGGASCTVTGGAVSYTAGATASYAILSSRTSDYVQLVSASGGPYLQTGGTLGTSAELFKITPSSAGFMFQALSSGNYVRNGGSVSPANDLVADVSSSASAALYLLNNCNGSGNSGSYNRFGFQSTSGGSPYWNANLPNIDAVNNGNGSACTAGSSSPNAGFVLSSGTDTLTISDSASHSSTVKVSVEPPLSFSPASGSVNVSSALPTAQVWGGSGVFTGGGAGCAVTQSNSGGATCSITGYGALDYTPGSSAGVDTLVVTDSQGHTGTFLVTVSMPFAVSFATSRAVASSAIEQSVTVSGGTPPYTCSVNTSSSGAATCGISAGTVVYTAGAVAGYNIMAARTTDYLRLVAGAGGPYVQSGGAVGSSAELWLMTVSGLGYTFQANSTGMYLRNAGSVRTGNDLVADVAAANAVVYTMQNCNGTGDSGLYNRFGFQGPSGTGPYWQLQIPPGYVPYYVEGGNVGSLNPCNTATAKPWEGYYLNPGQDVLTISDAASHSALLTINVEQPLNFQPALAYGGSSVAASTQVLGGSGIFTGGSSACAITSNVTGGSSCSLTGYGAVSYTPGATVGTDTLRITDSEGHTGTVQVSSGVTLSQLALSPNYFGCARVNDGSARCWGYNAHGELGNGTTSSYKSSASVVTGLSNVSAVVAGENHACALLGDGTIRCWGDNSLAQLGDGTQTSSSTPVAVSGIADAIAISAGMLHTCALHTDGTVACWGYNGSRQLGNAGTFPFASTPVTVTGLSGVSALAVGGFHSCALSSGGAVKCWGDNSVNQLGNGSTTNSFAPVSVTGLASGVSSIASGEEHSCALVGGAIKCWGDNEYGQLGNNSTSNASTPVNVSGIGSAAEVQAGFPFTCARLTDKSVKCWGRNTEGELGNLLSTDSLVPVAVSGLSAATSLAVGGVNACALLTSGLVTCWGYNAYGSLGNYATTDSHRATPLSFGCTTCGQPDLTVATPTWSPTTVAAGNTVTLSATIWNQGIGASPAGTVHGLRFKVDGTTVSSMTAYTTSITPGGVASITATNTWTATSGSHSVLVAVDYGSLISESDETNNSTSVTLVVP